MSDLNTNGYYTIAPDQRGYSFNARPTEISQDHISHLAKDALFSEDYELGEITVPVLFIRGNKDNALQRLGVMKFVVLF